ncbi:MAG TPA: CPBP family intramembrane glutamic endopeptidase [Pyrinomonadaceae bacterium]|nr:CPBP family intramembrane glutamic endopeptidase [Pyrinomonadaceae bacterium]
MFTEEPSTEQTPLATEPGIPSEAPANEVFSIPPPPAPPAIPRRDLRWHRLLLAIGTWFISLLLLLFVPLIVALPYFLYVWRTRGIPRPEVFATDKTLLFISILGIVPTHLLTLLLVWLVVTEWRKRPFWKTIGFEWPGYASPLVSTFGCIVIAASLFIIGGLVTSRWGGSKTQLDLLVESSLAARFATAFVAVFTAPLVEELIYRGVLYSAVEQALGRAVAIGSISLLFAGVHVFQYQNNIAVIVVITLLSFTLTLVRAYTGKLLPSFVIHLVFNGIQSVVIVLAPFFGWGSS